MDRLTAVADFQQTIELRRQELYERAKSLAETWFDREEGETIKTRFYVPDVRLRTKASSEDTISICWKRRFPVNNWQGKPVRIPGGGTKHIKVLHEHVPARKTGPAYPKSAFKNAPDEELADIMALEAKLAPIRKELAFLGKNRREFDDFYRALGVAIEAERWEDHLEIGSKATW